MTGAEVGTGDCVMSDAIPFVSLSIGTNNCVIGDSIPFVSFSIGTGTEVETEDCVMSDAIPFVSLTVETEAGTETERPTPQSPTIPDPIPNPIAPQAPPIPIPIPIPPLGAPPARAIRRFPCYNITSYKSSIRNLSLL